MRAPRHAAIAVMALTASTHAVEQKGIVRTRHDCLFNPAAPNNQGRSDAIETYERKCEAA